ncbi:hypothetical protein [Neorhodopirellula pilleata]|uniref:Glycosyltransferase RgtA/B/C/D-like domain-containing protein n=1 Tax=Neorhodopirellula pilleata TaxID=2714738 RepID=A0A5C6AWP1_9BACT|nr:hypothetical protein [Neorhodopirellula pilleata]TWU03486.1 hypothetical protein Pla100_04130 [Neorhodopirellula pilleata]
MTPSPKTFPLRLATAIAALMLVCFVSGRMTPHLVSDTPSYIDYRFASADEVARSVRTPGYPLLIRASELLFSSGESSLQALVIFQIVVHAIAVTVWLDELFRWSVPRRAAIVGCIAFAVTNTFWDHINTIATDSISMSLGMIIAALVVRVWRVGNSWRTTIAIGTLVIAVIAIRPAYLFLMPWMFAAMMFRPAGSAYVVGRTRWFDAIGIIMLPLVALIVWCGFRGSVTGDYGILPFGHQNMAAVTTQLLDNDELADLTKERFDPPLADLGAAIGRARWEVMDMHSRADSYMSLENRWDEMTYSIVIPAAERVIGGDVVVQHRALSKLDSAIVAEYPWRYAKWLALAIRRGVWGSAANMVMHPVYFPCWIALAVWAFVWSTRSSVQKNAIDWSPIKPLVMVTVSYALMKITFVALTSPPIGRFSDAAMALVPMLVGVVVAQLNSSR